jgi:predicted TIM-barrel fold metal-dependent hydrolase
MPQELPEDPVTAFRRNLWVHPFHEEDPRGLVELLGADRVIFGSDYPHPEGMSDPLAYVEEISDLPPGDIERIMGGNMYELLGVTAGV